MKYRKLGSTIVSEIGFGAWGIGGLTESATSYGPTDDSVSKAAIRTAIEKGINFFDTSNVYGDGRSEKLIGEVLYQNLYRNSVIIATKGGLSKHHGQFDLSEKNIRTSLENSLKRLKTSYIDLYQLHSPPIELVNKKVVSVLEQLKKEGLAKEFGISVKSPSDGLWAVDLGFKILQINFSMLDQRALEWGLMAIAEQKKVSLIARTPFCFGFLTGKLKSLDFDPRDHRSTWPKAQLERWLEGSKTFDAINIGTNRNLLQLALKFCLYFKVVSCVIPGIQTSAEAAENAAASQWPDLTPEETKAIREIYRNNNFFIPAT